MNWTRQATINEQTDGTTVDNRILINFLPREVPAVELIPNTHSFFLLDTQVSFVGRDGVCVTFKAHLHI